MGLFDRIARKHRPDVSVPPPAEAQREGFVLPSSSRVVEDIAYGEGDSQYRISFRLNDAFQSTKSHTGEVEMLYTYALSMDYGSEGTVPYLAIQCDDLVYDAVEAFKQTGTVEEALELTPLSGTFYFRAKMEYYGERMYFYGMDRCGGVLENEGLCLVYPKAIAGTEAEQKLLGVLDEAAESWQEERIA
ncbi:MAG: hypothetical protein HFG00_06955 [Oscillibacter sp.]|nr:hypothetical protein [Oscillibacter sp.]